MDKKLLDLGLDIEKRRNESGDRYRPDSEAKQKIILLLKEGKSVKELSFVTGIPKSTILGWKDKSISEVSKAIEPHQFKEVQLSDNFPKFFEASVKLQLNVEQLKMILNQC